MELVRLLSPKQFIMRSHINMMVVAFLEMLERDPKVIHFNYKMNFFMAS